MKTNRNALVNNFLCLIFTSIILYICLTYYERYDIWTDSLRTLESEWSNLETSQLHASTFHNQTANAGTDLDSDFENNSQDSTETYSVSVTAYDRPDSTSTHELTEVQDAAVPSQGVTPTTYPDQPLSVNIEPCTHLQCHDPSKPLCKFGGNSADYTVGTWQQLLHPPEFSTPNISNGWLDKNAYAYQDECNRRRFPCHVFEPNSCRAKAMHVASYQWMPQGCSLRPFDAELLDKSLGGKTVLFVGDSLMGQMFNSWRFLTRPVWRNESEALRMIDESYTTTGGNRFIFHWAEFILNGTTFKVDGISWAQRLQDEKVDVMVFNVGQHWHHVDKEFVKYHDMVTIVLEYLKQNFAGKIIFRTTTPGHYGCEDSLSSSPLDHWQELSPETDRYLWRKPVAADFLWSDVAYEMGFGDRFMYLNVSNSNFRADAHPAIRQGRGVDCLHWCLPGVPGIH